jgi:hypothetical protein
MSVSVRSLDGTKEGLIAGQRLPFNAFAKPENAG